MKTIEKSVLIWYSPTEMFNLVVAVPDYPKFLPWCDHATVLAEDGDGMTAEIGLSFSGVKQTFTTRNSHVAGSRVGMHLVDGPFSKLDGEWQFLPLGDGSQRACKIQFRLTYGFANAALAKLLGPVFDKVAGSLVDAFVKRAEQVYGAP
jgi:ribosome-associated toxin RatA of RatAB toxin-antitoxin module